MAKMGFITEQELPVLMATAKARGSKQHCLFLIKYWHGLRVSEISRLRVSDIRNGYLTVKRSKNSLHTEQPLHAHANPLFDTPAVLAAWLAERSKQCSLDDNPYLFTKERRRIVSAAAMAKRQSGDYSRQQIYKDMRETMLAAGIDSRRAHPHTIKHTTAAHAIRAGIDIAYVKELLRSQAHLLYRAIPAHFTGRCGGQTEQGHAERLWCAMTRSKLILAVCGLVGSLATYAWLLSMLAESGQ